MGRNLAFIEMMPLKYEFLVSYPLDTHHELHLFYFTNSSISCVYVVLAWIISKIWVLRK